MAGEVCVYTSLIGGYEALNEQPVAAGSQFRFICLTDDATLTSASWECRLVRPRFAMDPIRSHREFKLLPHRHLPDFAASLYIDNSVILTAPPERIWPLLPEGAGLALPRHSFRASVLDEFLAVLQLGMEDSSRLFEQLNHYALTSPQVLEEPPWWSAVMLRRHDDARVRDAMEGWYAQLLRYARRDQLSLNLALREAGLEPAALEIDNHQSWFHRWPVAPGRDRDRGGRNPLANLTPLVARLRMLEARPGEAAPDPAALAALGAEAAAARAEAGALRAEAEALRAEAVRLAAGQDTLRTEIALLRGSTSWRLTAPLRTAIHSLRTALRARGRR